MLRIEEVRVSACFQEEEVLRLKVEEAAEAADMLVVRREFNEGFRE